MKKISDAEWKIMNSLWESEPKTIMQLTKELYEETQWSKHTVMTYLKRMEQKGVVHFEEGAKAKLYYSDISRDEAVLEEKQRFLDKVFYGNVGLMVETMIAQEEFSKDDIDYLISLLEKKR